MAALKHPTPGGDVQAEQLTELAPKQYLTTLIAPGASLQLWGQAVTVVELNGVEATVRFLESGLTLEIPATMLSSTVERSLSDLVETRTDVTEAEWQRAKEIKDVVVVVINQRITSRSALSRLGAPIDLGYRQLQRWRLRFDGTVASLLERKPGRKEGSVVLPSALQLVMSEEISTAKPKLEQTSLAEVCRAIKKRCPPGLAPPQRSTIARYARKQDLHFKKRRDLGPSVVAEHAARYAKSHQVGQTLAEVQIDHTPIDMMVLDNTRRYVLGRPWLTLVLDVASRAILGFWLTFDAPSMVSVARALAMSAIPKHPLLQALGLGDLRWDVWGIGKLYVTDRAAEFRCADFKRACNAFDISHKLRPVGKKHWGGHIERAIGRMMGRFHLLPGTTFSNAKLRRLYNSEERAIFTAKDITKLLVTDIVDYMHSGHSSLGLTPQQAFFELLPHDDEGRPVLPGIIRDPASFALEWMPRETATNTKEGLRWRNHRYFHDDLRQIPLGEKITLIPDHATSEVIALIGGRKVRLERRTPATYEDISFETELNAAKRARAGEPDVLEMKERALGHRDLIVATGESETKAAKKKGTSRERALAENDRSDQAPSFKESPTIYDVD